MLNTSKVQLTTIYLKTEVISFLMLVIACLTIWLYLEINPADVTGNRINQQHFTVTEMINKSLRLLKLKPTPFLNPFMAVFNILIKLWHRVIKMCQWTHMHIHTCIYKVMPCTRLLWIRRNLGSRYEGNEASWGAGLQVGAERALPRRCQMGNPGSGSHMVTFQVFISHAISHSQFLCLVLSTSRK